MDGRIDEIGWDEMGWGEAGRGRVVKCGEVRLCRSFFYYIREGSIILTGARHPGLEIQDKISFIPKDVTLTKGIEAMIILPMSLHTPFRTPTSLAIRHAPLRW